MFSGRAQEAEEHAESRPPCQHDSKLLEVEKMILKPERHADADRVVAENRVLPDDGFQILLFPARFAGKQSLENRRSPAQAGAENIQNYAPHVKAERADTTIENVIEIADENIPVRKYEKKSSQRKCQRQQKRDEAEIIIRQQNPIFTDVLAFADGRNFRTMPHELRSADAAAFLLDGGTDKYIAVVQNPSRLPENESDFALTARSTGLERGKIGRVNAIVFLFVIALGIGQRLVVIAFLSQFKGFYRPRQQVADTAYEKLYAWLGNPSYRPRCFLVPYRKNTE